MTRIRRPVLFISTTIAAMMFMSMAQVQAVSVNTIGDNVTSNSGAGFVLLVSLQRNR